LCTALLQNNAYDFNLQQFVVLDGQPKIMPGDQLITRCTYNSTGRTSMTQGGLSTKDEMCVRACVCRRCEVQVHVACFFAGARATGWCTHERRVCSRVSRLTTARSPLRWPTTTLTVPACASPATTRTSQTFGHEQRQFFLSNMCPFISLENRNYSNFDAAWSAALATTALIQPICFDSTSPVRLLHCFSILTRF
jgi:hypothetical protein